MTTQLKRRSFAKYLFMSAIVPFAASTVIPFIPAAYAATITVANSSTDTIASSDWTNGDDLEFTSNVTYYFTPAAGAELEIGSVYSSSGAKGSGNLYLNSSNTGSSITITNFSYDGSTYFYFRTARFCDSDNNYIFKSGGTIAGDHSNGDGNGNTKGYPNIYFGDSPIAETSYNIPATFSIKDVYLYLQGTVNLYLYSGTTPSALTIDSNTAISANGTLNLYAYAYGMTSTNTTMKYSTFSNSSSDTVDAALKLYTPISIATGLDAITNTNNSMAIASGVSSLTADASAYDTDGNKFQNITVISELSGTNATLYVYNDNIISNTTKTHGWFGTSLYSNGNASSNTAPSLTTAESYRSLNFIGDYTAAITDTIDSSKYYPLYIGPVTTSDEDNTTTTDAGGENGRNSSVGTLTLTATNAYAYIASVKYIKSLTLDGNNPWYLQGDMTGYGSTDKMSITFSSSNFYLDPNNDDSWSEYANQLQIDNATVTFLNTPTFYLWNISNSDPLSYSLYFGSNASVGTGTSSINISTYLSGTGAYGDDIDGGLLETSSTTTSLLLTIDALTIYAPIDIATGIDSTSKTSNAVSFYVYNASSSNAIGSVSLYNYANSNAFLNVRYSSVPSAVTTTPSKVYIYNDNIVADTTQSHGWFGTSLYDTGNLLSTDAPSSSSYYRNVNFVFYSSSTSYTAEFSDYVSNNAYYPLYIGAVTTSDSANASTTSATITAATGALELNANNANAYIGSVKYIKSLTLNSDDVSWYLLGDIAGYDSSNNAMSVAFNVATLYATPNKTLGYAASSSGLSIKNSTVAFAGSTLYLWNEKSSTPSAYFMSFTTSNLSGSVNTINTYLYGKSTVAGGTFAVADTTSTSTITIATLNMYLTSDILTSIDTISNAANTVPFAASTISSVNAYYYGDGANNTPLLNIRTTMSSSASSATSSSVYIYNDNVPSGGITQTHGWFGTALYGTGNSSSTTEPASTNGYRNINFLGDYTATLTDTTSDSKYYPLYIGSVTTSNLSNTTATDTGGENGQEEAVGTLKLNATNATGYIGNVLYIDSLTFNGTNWYLTGDMTGYSSSDTISINFNATNVYVSPNTSLGYAESSTALAIKNATVSNTKSGATFYLWNSSATSPVGYQMLFSDVELTTATININTYLSGTGSSSDAITGGIFAFDSGTNSSTFTISTLNIYAPVKIASGINSTSNASNKVSMAATAINTVNVYDYTTYSDSTTATAFLNIRTSTSNGDLYIYNDNINSDTTQSYGWFGDTAIYDSSAEAYDAGNDSSTDAPSSSSYRNVNFTGNYTAKLSDAASGSHYYPLYIGAVTASDASNSTTVDATGNGQSSAVGTLNLTADDSTGYIGSVKYIKSLSLGGENWYLTGDVTGYDNSNNMMTVFLTATSFAVVPDSSYASNGSTSGSSVVFKNAAITFDASVAFYLHDTSANNYAPYSFDASSSTNSVSGLGTLVDIEMAISSTSSYSKFLLPSFVSSQQLKLTLYTDIAGLTSSVLNNIFSLNDAVYVSTSSTTLSFYNIYSTDGTASNGGSGSILNGSYTSTTTSDTTTTTTTSSTLLIYNNNIAATYTGVLGWYGTASSPVSTTARDINFSQDYTMTLTDATAAPINIGYVGASDSTCYEAASSPTGTLVLNATYQNATIGQVNNIKNLTLNSSTGTYTYNLIGDITGLTDSDKITLQIGSTSAKNAKYTSSTNAMVTIVPDSTYSATSSTITVTNSDIYLYGNTTWSTYNISTSTSTSGVTTTTYTGYILDASDDSNTLYAADYASGSSLTLKFLIEDDGTTQSLGSNIKFPTNHDLSTDLYYYLYIYDEGTSDDYYIKDVADVIPADATVSISSNNSAWMYDSTNHKLYKNSSIASYVLSDYTLQTLVLSALEKGLTVSDIVDDILTPTSSLNIINLANSQSIKATMNTVFDRTMIDINPAYDISSSSSYTTIPASQSLTVEKDQNEDNDEKHLEYYKTHGYSFGDAEASKFGLWTQVYMARSHQRTLDSVHQAYSSKNHGTVIGADIATNDHVVLGVFGALGTIRQNNHDTKSAQLRFKNRTTGAYISYLLNNILLGGAVSGTWSRHHDTSMQYNSSTEDYSRMYANYNTKVIRLDGSMSYTYLLKSFVFSPTVRVSYDKTSSVSYTTYGDDDATNIKNLLDSKKTAIGSVGASLMKGIMINKKDNLSATVEMHAFIEKRFSSSPQLMTMYLGTATTPITTYNDAESKYGKKNYNCGMSANIKSPQYDAGLGLDFFFSRKYIGYQGTFKVRVRL